MKKHFKYVLLVVLFVCTTLPSWGQATTEGSDFWVTFLQADQDNNNNLKLELTITSRTNCSVTIENPFTSYSQTEQVTAAQSKTINLYTGDVRAQQARNTMNNSGKVCYAVNSEQVDQCALHVTAKDKDGKPVKISLFASSYKKATFDATNVLPTTSLMDEYIVQTYTPSDHGGVGATQGSHFAIIAAEDGVVVDYWPTVATTGHAANSKVTTPALQKGQVWYVWTGKKDGEPGDLSGTRVVARDGKKIAVFQGCPHTNIPYQIKQRDHIFSQAMPTAYWGSRFVITASKERKKDIIRVLALYDHTRVFINGELAHTFNFNNEPKHYCEFVIGENGDYAESGSCYLTTSCPCAVHLFMASQDFDGVSNGDPAMLWMNPIEQRIDQITFATYNSSNGTTQHYTNIVTDRPELMTLDGTSIASEFKRVDGSPDFFYAQYSLGTNATSHTLKSDGSSFIAHVYGFTDNESYGYSAGSATIGRQISVNDIAFESGEKAKGIDDAPTFCANDTVLYDLRDISGSIFRIVLDFGDGTSKDTVKNNDEPFIVSIKHAYPTPGWYDANAIVYGEEFCTQPAFQDTIPIIFRIVRPDTIIVPPTSKECLDTTEWKALVDTYGMDSLKTLLANGKRQILNPDTLCYVDRQLSLVPYGIETAYEFNKEDNDSIYLNNQWYFPETLPSDGIIRWTIEDGNQYGCDSFVICHAKINTCLGMIIPNDPDKQKICLGDKALEVGYTKSKGEIKDNIAIFTINELPQFKAEISVSAANISSTLSLPMDDGNVKVERPGYYTGKLKMDDPICTDQPREFPLNFTVNYPSDIFEFKFNNVLAVYQNKGYTFTNYQWYRNDAPIQGATESILYLGQGVTFNKGDVVYVELTDKNGMTLSSCSQTLINIPDYSSQSNSPARKLIQNSHIVILRDEKTFNVYGQRVQ